MDISADDRPEEIEACALRLLVQMVVRVIHQNAPQSIEPELRRARLKVQTGRLGTAPAPYHTIDRRYLQLLEEAIEDPARDNSSGGE